MKHPEQAASIFLLTIIREFCLGILVSCEHGCTAQWLQEGGAVGDLVAKPCDAGDAALVIEAGFCNALEDEAMQYYAFAHVQYDGLISTNQTSLRV